MSEEQREQKKINKLIFNARVPKGLRPETPEEIDALLDVTDAQEYSEDKIQRMMKKIKGELPIGEREPEATYEQYEATEHETELMAMYRDGNEDISAETKKKLDEMRKRAKKSQHSDIEEEDEHKKE